MAENNSLVSIQANFGINLLINTFTSNPHQATALSPISLITALSMLIDGARGNTKYEFKRLLVGDGDEIRLHQYFNEFLTKLKKKSGIELKSANKIYVKNGLVIEKMFTDTVNHYYQGQFETIDFSNTALAVKSMNDFIEEATNNLIKNMIKPQAIGHSTQMVLINAIYFKAKWLCPFELESTREDDFYLNQNDTKKVQMMYQETSFLYSENNHYQVVSMKYKGSDVSMIIVLPKIKNNLVNIMQQFDYSQLEKLISAFKYKPLKMYLPKFKIEATHNFNEALIKLGLVDAFDSRANFSGITTQTSLQISQVLQQVVVAVDEEGTEAAAATAIFMLESMMLPPKNQILFKANHSFMYFLMDEAKILFNGFYA
uniref:SERPIN domain-containing protein n=1 Tax=Rhabditophanes sp. KR3021 TaxID=114890 RepID=A0AC35TL41_9BILA